MGGLKFIPLIFFFAFTIHGCMGFSVKSIGGKNVEFLRKEKEMKWIFSEWQVKYDKSYDHPMEETKRFEIFKNNFRYIAQHNRPENNHSFTLALNKFADLTTEDFAKFYLINYNNETSLSHQSDRYTAVGNENLPNFVDWRVVGAVTPVEDQGDCGSSWAFSAIGAVEGMHQIISGELLTLSKQDLLDCDYHSSGCRSGSPISAFKYIEENGVDEESHYPYQGVRQSCSPIRERAVYIDNYERIRNSNEHSLKKAVSNQPVSVSIQSNSPDLMFYNEGVFNGRCGQTIDHVVLAVGYGSKDGEDYWLVKNSWGEIWGENGYIRLQRGYSGPFGKCGIATSPAYPVIDPPYKVAGESSTTK